MRRYRFVLLAALLLIAGCSGHSTPTPPGVTTLSDVTLRAGPGSDYAVVAQVPENTQVALLGVARSRDCASWVLVRTADGIEGWTVPVLVNVDVAKSVLPTAPLPTADPPPTPLPSACNSGLALVQIGNHLPKSLQVSLAGPEPEFTLSVESGALAQICLAPGDYCYDLTDGNKHETGSLFFAGGRCTCWNWGGDPGHCQCSEDVGQYERP